MSEKFEVSETTETVKSNTVKASRRIPGKPTAWKDGEVEEILLAYQNGDSATTIGDRHGVGYGVILRLLKTHKITVRKCATSCKFDENFFENIDTEAKAYFLGLLLTDGNVSDRRRIATEQCSISLGLVDGYILEDFKQVLGFEGTIHAENRDDRGWQTLYTMRLTSDKMAADLAKYSVVPRKSFIKKFTILDNEDMMRHFIRGILDGDGSIRKHKDKRIPKVSFNGPYDLVNDIYEYLTKKLNLSRPKNIQKNNVIFTVD